MNLLVTKEAFKLIRDRTMTLISDRKLNLTKAMRHYMGMRLKFRGTVFVDVKPQLQAKPAAPKPAQPVIKH